MDIQINGTTAQSSRGYLSEIEFMGFATKKGWCVTRPIIENLPVDFVVSGIDSDKLFKTVQIRSSYSYKGKERLDLRQCHTRNKKFSQNAFDYLIAHNPKKNLWYKIPWSKINHRTEIDLSRKEFEKYEIN